MKLECELIKKTFTTEDGQSRDYNALSFKLADGSTLEVTIKSDKAKLLAMSYNISSKNEKPSFLR